MLVHDLSHLQNIFVFKTCLFRFPSGCFKFSHQVIFPPLEFIQQSQDSARVSLVYKGRLQRLSGEGFMRPIPGVHNLIARLQRPLLGAEQ